MRYDVHLGSISWIDPRYLPPVNAALVSQTVGNAWMVKSVMGLAATANYTPPPPHLVDVAGYLHTNAFRSLTAAHVYLDVAPGSQALTRVTEAWAPVLSPGYTPPFSRSLYPSGILLGLLDWGIHDRTFYRGELSPISGVRVAARHPYGTLQVPPGDEVVAHTLIKFRAGEHTDKQGTSWLVGAQFHVPWVWCELLVSYAPTRLRLQAVGSAFPSHAWYLAGSQRLVRHQAGDLDFIGTWQTTMTSAGGSTTFWCEAEKMNLYRVLAKGASAKGNQTALSSEHTYPQPSAITGQLNTVEAGEAGTFDLPLAGVPTVASH